MWLSDLWNEMKITSFTTIGNPSGVFYFALPPIPPVKTGGYLQCVPSGLFFLS
jgi:hypothetical protein